jgi:hypothetical protein
MFSGLAVVTVVLFLIALQMGATGTSAVLEPLKNPVSVPLYSSCGCGFGFSSGYPR